MTPDLAAALTGATARLLGFGRDRLREYALAESPSGDAAALARCAALIEAGHREAGGTVSREAGGSVTCEAGGSVAREGGGFVAREGGAVPREGGGTVAREGGGAVARGGEHLVSRFGPQDGPHVLLVGHYDTVWPVGRLDTMPYTDDGTTITGPGTYDMKGGLVAVEMALRALRAAGTAPARQVRLVVVADEEVGSPTGRAVVERHLDGAVAVLGLESPHPDGALKNARRGSVRVRLGVRGREAHAALDPGKGVSAIDELIDQLAAVRGVVPADGTTLLNIGRIEGGRRANVVAGEAWAELGLRFASAEAERTVLDALAALEPVRTGAVVEATVLSARPTWPERSVDPLLDHIAGIGELLGQRITGRPAAGAGDTNLPGSRGLPTLDGFGPPGRGAHAADEAVRVAGLAERAALLAGIMTFPPPDVMEDHG